MPRNCLCAHSMRWSSAAAKPWRGHKCTRTAMKTTPSTRRRSRTCAGRRRWWSARASARGGGDSLCEKAWWPHTAVASGPGCCGKTMPSSGGGNSRGPAVWLRGLRGAAGVRRRPVCRASGGDAVLCAGADQPRRAAAAGDVERVPTPAAPSGVGGRLRQPALVPIIRDAVAADYAAAFSGLCGFDDQRPVPVERTGGSVRPGGVGSAAEVHVCARGRLPHRPWEHI